MHAQNVAYRQDTSDEPRRLDAQVLSVLAGLFFLRVAGQMLVARFDVRFLPAMEHWYSGLLPYPILLTAQIVIVALQVRMCADFWRGHGYFVAPKPAAGRVLKWLSYLYAAAMATRYVVTMALFPERRWLGGVIPIVFHLVLAAYLFAYSHFHCLGGRVNPDGRQPALER